MTEVTSFYTTKISVMTSAALPLHMLFIILSESIFWEGRGDI